MNPWSFDSDGLDHDISVSLPAFKNVDSPCEQSIDSDNDIANAIFASTLDIVRTEESEENRPESPSNEKFASFFK